MDRRPMTGTTEHRTFEPDFTAAVEARVARLITAGSVRWRKAPHAEDLFADLHRASLSGGKRLRSTFCWWGYVGARGSIDLLDDHLIQAGAALELLHTFAVIHDDVMDGSPTRRGTPAIHAMQASRHRQGSWRGERRRFAEGVAVLIGDLAFNLAQEEAGRLPAPAQQVWRELCEELVVGQHLDLLATATGDRQLDTAIRTTVLKSAHYTVVRPLQLGAALADGHDRLAPVYAAYGDPLGEAFQLRDDLLGVFGDPVETGKPVDDDLREGKPTMLIALAHHRADNDDRAMVDRVGAPDLTNTELATIREIIERTGARTAVEQRITTKVRLALAALNEAELCPTVDHELRRLASRLAWRTG